MFISPMQWATVGGKRMVRPSVLRACAATTCFAALLALAGMLATGGLKVAHWSRVEAAGARRLMPQELRTHARRLAQAPAGSPAAAPAGSPAAAPAPQPAYTHDLNHTVTTRSNFIQDVATPLGGFAQFFSGGCEHGNWCGQTCVGQGGDSIDNLDEACKVHDECLNDPEYEQYDSTEKCPIAPTPNCQCDQALRDAANNIYETEKKGCSWWNVFCWESGKVESAWLLGQTFNAQLYCGSCQDGLPPNYVAPIEPEASSGETSLSTDGDTSTSDTEGVTSTSDSDTSDGTCPYTVEFDTDLYGGDLADDAYYSVSGWEECCSLCNDDADCYAWTYAPAIATCDGGPCCFLKASSGYSSQSAFGLVSGTYSG